MGTYDDQNIFAKILRGEIPSQTVYEDEYVIAIHDAYPKAPVHVLILPKGPYISMTDFSSKATELEQAAMVKAVAHVVRDMGLDENGYRLIANNGGHGGQEIAHLHWHIVGGAPVGPMLVEQED